MSGGDGRKDLVEIVRALSNYQWILHSSLVSFFKDDVWSLLPESWKTCLSLLTPIQTNNLPFGYYEEHWPDSLIEFVQLANKINLVQDLENRPAPRPMHPSLRYIKGMSPKKIHEVERMTDLIDRNAKLMECGTVVDVGIGAGYISHSLQLQSQNTYNIIGIEGNSSHSSSLLQRISTINQSLRRSIDGDNDDSSSQNNSNNNIVNNKKNMRFGSCKAEVKKKSNNNNMSEVKNISVVNWFIDSSDQQLELKFNQILDNAKSSSSTLPTTSNLHDRNDDESDNDNFDQVQNNNIDISDGGGECNQISNETQIEERKQRERAAIIGLHSCGDLTVAILKLFAVSMRSKLLVCVGCCYDKLTVDHRFEVEKDVSSPSPAPSPSLSSSSQNHVDQQNRNSCFGFPMSRELYYILEETGLKVGSKMMNLAVQCPQRWRSRTLENILYATKTISYRAVLEHVIASKLPDGFSVALRDQSVSAKVFDNFGTYLDSILPKLCMKRNSQTGGSTFSCNTLNDEDDRYRELRFGTTAKNEYYKLPFNVEIYRDELNSTFRRLEPDFPNVNTFQALKMILQRMIESLIVLDRKYFLFEHDIHDVEILPIFDETISPRNIAIVARKHQC